jgi:hypothetical protein
MITFVDASKNGGIKLNNIRSGVRHPNATADRHRLWWFTK